MSLLLIEPNALCLHVPFCGGTWVRHALKAAGVATRNALLPNGREAEHGLRHHFRPQDQGQTAFAFVRHPLAWYESYWLRSRHAPPKGDYPDPAFRRDKFLPFDSIRYCLRAAGFTHFIRNCLQWDPGHVSRMYEWYLGPVGASAVDYFGRLDNLQSDLAGIIGALGYVGQTVEAVATIDLPPQNPRPQIEIEWPDDLRAKMLAAEAPAITRFFRKE
jgi:hypothetical protein